MSASSDNSLEVETVTVSLQAYQGMAQQSHFTYVSQDYLCNIALTIAISPPP